MTTDGVLTIVIPCYNESENIPVFFPKLLNFLEAHDHYALVINDGSQDDTAIKLNEFAGDRIKIIHNKRNCGYGAAIKRGLLATKTQFAITIDADGQHRLEDVQKCFECIKSKNADLVIGARSNNLSGAYRSFGKKIIYFWAKSLLQFDIKDLNSGMKCYEMNEAGPYFILCPDSMAFSDVIALLMINDRKLVMEESIEVVPRQSGVSTINMNTALTTIAEILNLSILVRPLTTFCRFGIFFLLIGLGWGVYTYLRSSTITNVTTVFVMFSGFSILTGLLCEQLSQIRKTISKYMVWK
ncbi:MAG: glycosyltransferase family 2 protein [Victivallaceae bacterium]